MDLLPEENSSYGTQEYWDSRYEREPEGSTFDWFKTYADVKGYLNEAIPSKSSRILMLGCGNSTLSQDMYDDGYKNIVNVDYSPVVIEKMKISNESRPEMSWVTGDIRKLHFEDDSFDVALDKGTMDAMMTEKGDVWNPSQKVIDDCKAEVDEVTRVLNPKGVFIYITFGQPHFRKRHLERPGYNLKTVQIGEAFFYYMYILKKAQN